MIQRFLEGSGRRVLVDSLRRQHAVEGSEELAAALADVGQLVELAPGEILITQDATDNCIYLIVAGRFSILVNGREVAVRGPGCHVGEMALIDPSAPRSASVVAIERAVVLKVDESSFSLLAERFSRLWRMLALELADRLRQRNRLVVPTNPRPFLFVGSSSESLPIAQAIQAGLAHDDIRVKLWTDGVFLPSHYPVDDLIAEVRQTDFATLVFAPDDRIFSRGVDSGAPRDNVVYELGLAMGRLERDRTFIILPRGADMKIPTDLLGLNPIAYHIGPENDLAAALAPVCTELRNSIRRLKVK